ncbi:hypothetical protein KM176_17930 [Pseudooceanicola sp. CBS1P-1]|uniref:Cytochrome-c peroxidase n=1 Tax=Pseudooceanicola albus TaxID=2692189 RepID=A0A6L7G8U7_9RHOB|nr:MULTISPECIES: cytochrome c peroxidase [Pseudooceanicola]MBT9385755.1 hypothetical protein [Pseudooceanicola endophyticus]MXN19987.1 cytochrome-c peroxidase [Pseudooceanicola albus]
MIPLPPAGDRTRRAKARRVSLSTALLILCAGLPAHADTKLSAMAAMGRDMFHDPHLSGTGEMSCASCHDPANHFAPGPGSAVVKGDLGASEIARGGPGGTAPGFRAVPSLTYRDRTPPFSVGPVSEADEQGEASPMAVSGNTQAPATGTLAVATLAPTQAKGADAAANMVPRGGMFWDGRAATLQAQANGPLMAPYEMANTDTATLAAHLRTGYGARLSALFGPQILKDDTLLVAEAEFALARYQVEDPAFHPYDSKYDAWLAGKATLTPAEERGRVLFNDPKKGNCADCHIDTADADGRPPVFTDYEYEALGVPRNPAIPANADPGWFDLGLCGPMRDDAYAKPRANCGLFKTPSLRNVATRGAFFHNGVYHTLPEVVRFYVDRSTDPKLVYGQADPSDLPKDLRGNLDTVDPPFDRPLGAQPALEESEVRDIVAFLDTLTDGWSPPAP